MSKLAYSIIEAAAATGYSERTIREQVKLGNIAARYANSKCVIRAEDLAAWLDRLPSEAK